MKPSILVTREVFDETLDYLREHCEVEANQQDIAFDPETLARKLADKDGVMCALTDRIDAKLIERCSRLKVVANIAVGYNNIDLPACTSRGVMATNTPGVLDDSTADLAWALMLATARRLTEVEGYVREGEWKGWRLKQWLGVDVHHATLGILGMGRIGQAIAKRAAGFEMKVLYNNRKRVAAALEQTGDEIAHWQLVIDEQDGLVASRRRHHLRFLFGPIPVTGHRGEIQTKSRAPTGLALDRDPATMLLDDAIDRGEAQPGSAPHFLGGEERIEDARQHRLRDAAAGVGHRQAHIRPWLQDAVRKQPLLRDFDLIERYRQHAA